VPLFQCFERMVGRRTSAARLPSPLPLTCRKNLSKPSIRKTLEQLEQRILSTVKAFYAERVYVYRPSLEQLESMTYEALRSYS